MVKMKKIFKIATNIGSKTEKNKKKGWLKLLLFNNSRPMQILNMLFKRP